MKDENVRLNDLNIPPNESSGFRFDWFNFLQLMTPIALGFVYYKGKQEKADLQEKLNLEIALRKESELKLKNIPDFGNELFQQEIAKIKKEEEERAKLTLNKLSNVENYIKQILDIRCSPVKLRIERERIERYVMGLSHSEQLNSLGMQDGLNQIFQFDGKHCGGGYNNNGQIYRVWMRWWRAQVEQDKNSRIAIRKAELYKANKAKYF